MDNVKSQKSKVRILLTITTFAFFILPFPLARPALAALTVRANHDDIKVDFFYHGSTVSVSGEADGGTDLIIKVASADGNHSLRKKGKVGGVLWMNVGNIHFENAPNLYLVHGTKNVDAMLVPGEAETHVIGYAALKKHVEIAPVADENEKARWFDEFVKFKESSNLYGTSSGNIATKLKENGRQEYYIMFPWPYQATPGDYTVTVYAVKDGKVVEKADTNVRVEQVGTVKTLAGMAKDRAALYGLLSIGAALGAGFGVGMIFRKGGGSH